MYKQFKMDDTYTLPSGENVKGADLVSRKDYTQYATGTWIVRVINENTITSFFSYDDMKDLYGIDEPNMDSFIAELNRVISLRNKLRNNNFDTMHTIMTAASFVALSFTDEQALEVPDLYPEYEVDHAYKKDERFTYNGRLFKVNQAHTSAAQWVPGETGTESLYTCLEMAGDGYLVWTQPTGAHNAYNTGDIVHYPTEDDPLYKSLIDGNSWSPDAYPQGWEIYNKE